MLWRASPFSITASTKNAIALAEQLAFSSVALPLIGAGSGGMTPSKVQALMLETLRSLASDLRVVLVRYRRSDGCDPSRSRGSAAHLPK